MHLRADVGRDRQLLDLDLAGWRDRDMGDASRPTRSRPLLRRHAGNAHALALGQLLGRLLRHGDELFGMGIGQRLQQNALEDTEDHGVGPHARRERDQGDDREHGCASEPAQDLFELIGKGFHGRGPFRAAIAACGPLAR